MHILLITNSSLIGLSRIKNMEIMPITGNVANTRTSEVMDLGRDPTAATSLKQYNP